MQDKLALMASGHEIWLEQPREYSGSVESVLVTTLVVEAK